MSTLKKGQLIALILLLSPISFAAESPNPFAKNTQDTGSKSVISDSEADSLKIQMIEIQRSIFELKNGVNKENQTNTIESVEVQNFKPVSFIEIGNKYYIKLSQNGSKNPSYKEVSEASYKEFMNSSLDSFIKPGATSEL